MGWPSSDEYRGASFYDVSMAGASFREVDLTGVTMRGVALLDIDIDGYIGNVVINGVDVAPLIGAQLDRRHPERLLMRSAEPAELRQAWAVLEAQWQATNERIGALPEELQHRRVDDEYSAVETLRHLIFATDAWYGRAIAGELSPYHPIGLPCTGMDDQDAPGVDSDAAPSLDTVLEVRRSRQDMVGGFLAMATTDTLQAPAPQVEAPGWPRPNEGRKIVQCLHVILDEEWAHHRFCVRDLDALERAEGAPPGGS
jgi:DinB family protein